MPKSLEDMQIHELRIPMEILREFKEQPRIIWHDGFPIGIPVPDIRLLERIKDSKDFQIFIGPKVLTARRGR